MKSRGETRAYILGRLDDKWPDLATDAADRANLRPAGRPKKTDDNTSSNVINSSDGKRKRKCPTGNSTEKAMRVLRDKRPDIHARVLAGEISAHAGMIRTGHGSKPVKRGD